MPTIAKVTWPEFKLSYGWCFIVRDLLELESWWMSVRLPKSQQELSDALQSNKDKTHAQEGSWLICLAKTKEISIVDALVQLNEDGFRGMSRTLTENGGIVIQASGSYMPLTSKLELTYEHDTEEFIFPKDQIRVLKWQGGTHWYAKIGDIDVVWEGCQKWDTKKQARKAAEAFLKTFK